MLKCDINSNIFQLFLKKNNLVDIINSFKTDSIYIVGSAVKEVLGYGEAYNDVDIIIPTKEFQKIPSLLPEAKYVESNNIYILNKTEISSYDDLEANLNSRDFTINSIAINIKDGSIIDYTDGLEDLSKGIICCNNDFVFTEDPVRIYRAARIAAENNYQLSSYTKGLIQGKAYDFTNVPNDRVSKELIKALQTQKPSVFFNILKDTDCLSYHFEEIKNLVNVPQPIEYHNNLCAYEHTMNVLDTVQTTDPKVKFAALCHDLGKGITPPDKYPQHLNHDKEGVALVENIAQRLDGLPKSWIQAAKFTSKNHMKARTVERPKKLISLYLEAEQNIGFESFLDIIDADGGKESTLSKKRIQVKKIAQMKINFPKELKGEEIGAYILEQKAMELGKILHRTEKNHSFQPTTLPINIGEVPFINTTNKERIGNMYFNQDTKELSIRKLAEHFGKEPTKRTLPNGKEIEQIVWEGEDMVAINKEIHNNDIITSSGTVNLDGAAPAWLVAGLAHECHPASCTVSTPQGKMPIGCKLPEGLGQAENIKFNITETDDWKTIHAEQIDSSVPLDLSKVGDWIPPEIEMGDKIRLSGRMPNIAMASIAQAYQHKASAVGFFQPGTGTTVSITHTPEVPLGAVFPEPNIARKEKLNNLQPSRPSANSSAKL